MHHLIKSAVCPFFLNATAFGIKCEGFGDAVTVKLCFGCKESMKAHSNRYCTRLDGYKECPLYPMIMEQYKEDDDA